MDRIRSVIFYSLVEAKHLNLVDWSVLPTNHHRLELDGYIVTVITYEDVKLQSSEDMQESRGCFQPDSLNVGLADQNFWFQIFRQRA